MSCLFICYISYNIFPLSEYFKNSNNLVLEILNQLKVGTLYFKLFFYLKLTTTSQLDIVSPLSEIPF